MPSQGISARGQRAGDHQLPATEPHGLVGRTTGTPRHAAAALTLGVERQTLLFWGATSRCDALKEHGQLVDPVIPGAVT